jgi:hypothetical protein
MATKALEGVGATVTFGTSDYTADLISFTLPERATESIDTSHLGTTDYMTSKPSSLSDPGQLQLVFDYDPAMPDLRDDGAQTVTITLADSSTLTFSNAYCISQGGSEGTIGERMQESVTMQLSGDYVYAAASS